MNVKVIMKDFEIHTTPLEKIIIDTYSIEIYLDDISGNRYKISVNPYQAIKIKTIDCVSSADYYNEFCFREGRYHRHILLVEGSYFMKELSDKNANLDFLKNSKHYVFPLQDNIIDLIAFDFKLEKC